jgi:predicted nucleic acid-binding protein
VVLKWLIDTNLALYFLGGLLAEPMPEGEYAISVITEMELLSYPELDPEAERNIRAFISSIERIGLSDEIIQTAIDLRRRYSLKLPDAIIASTACVSAARLLTNDTKLLHVAEITCQQARLMQ